MQTVGDVRAEVDRTLRDLDKLRVGELAPLIERVEKLAAGHPDVLQTALGRIRERIPSPLVLPRVPTEPYRSYIPSLSPQSLPPPTPVPAGGQRPIQDVSPCELGFDENIPAGKSTVTTRPQLVFRPAVLIIPNEECCDGDLVEIFVGGRPQPFLVGGKPLPLSRFCPARWADVELMEKASVYIETIRPGQAVSLVVNVKVPVRFQAILRGIGAR